MKKKDTPRHGYRLLKQECVCEREADLPLLIQALTPMPLNYSWACEAEQGTETLENMSCLTHRESSTSVLDLLVNFIHLFIHITSVSSVYYNALWQALGKHSLSSGYLHCGLGGSVWVSTC